MTDHFHVASLQNTLLSFEMRPIEMWMYPRSMNFRLCVPAFLILATSRAGCATGHYRPLGEAGTTEIEQLKENVYRVEYRTSGFTSHEQVRICRDHR